MNIDFKNTDSVYWGAMKIKEVYLGATKLWEAVKVIEISLHHIGVPYLITEAVNLNTGYVLRPEIVTYIQSKGINPEQVYRIYSPRDEGHSWDVVITQNHNTGEYHVERSGGESILDIAWYASVGENAPPNEFYYE